MLPLLKLHSFFGRRNVALKLSLFAQIVLLFLVSGERLTEAAVPISAIQPPPFSASAAQDKKDVRLLELGKSIAREIKEGEIHFYQITLAAGQFLSVVVEQKGIDVVLELHSPDDKKLADADFSNGGNGPEKVSWIAETHGIYALKVSLLGKASGRYEINRVELRATTSQDAKIIMAERLLSEARELTQQEITILRNKAILRNRAIKKYYEALQVWRDTRDQVRECFTLYEIALATQDNHEALEYLRQSLLLGQMLKFRWKEVDILQRIGLAYYNLSLWEKALDYWNRGLSLARAVGNRSSEAVTLSNIGATYRKFGDHEKALEFFEQALSVRQTIVDRPSEAETRVNIGGAYYKMGEKQKALESFNQALQIYRMIGNRPKEAESLYTIGYAYMLSMASMADGQKALEHFNESLSLYRALGDRQGEADSLYEIGVTYGGLHKRQQAIEYISQAVSSFRLLNNKPREIQALESLASNLFMLGEYPQSLNYYRQVQTLKQDLKYPDNTLTQMLTSMGFIHDTLGDKQRALQYYEASLKIALKSPLNLESALNKSMTLTAMGFLYASSGNGEKALEFLNQALPLTRLAKNRRMEGAALCSMGLAYDVLGEKQKALEYLNQGLERLRSVGERVFEALALTRIGLIHNSLGNPQKGIEFLNEALAVSRSVRDRSGEANALYEIARAARTQNNLTEARSRIEEALKIVESLRSRVNSQELRTALLAAKHDYYNFYLALLMQLHQQNPSAGHNTLALQISERARARSLLETLIESRADIRQGVDPTLLERERSLQRRINAQELSRTKLLSGKHSPEQAETAEKELQTSLIQFQEVQAQIRANSPRYAALTQPEPLSVPDIQKQVLDADTVLLEYALGAERSYLWAVTPTSITSYELPARAVIEKEVSRIYNLLSGNSQTKERTDNGNQFLQEAASLSRMLLGPVAAQLGKKRVVIVADGALQFLPFGALPVQPSGNETNTANAQNANLVPLLVEHEIVNLPSASVLAVMRRETAGRKAAAKQIAVLADPVFDKSDERVQLAGQKQLAQANTKSAGREVPASQREETASRETDAVLLDDDLPRTLRDVGAVRADKTIPRLVWTREEASTILATVPAAEGMKSLDFNASRATATSATLSQYRIVHFATHGMLNSEHPELSGLVFSLVDEKGQPQDGFLRMHDVYNLNLPADLVVLSACQTGLGKEIKGEGLVGLTRGFMYAGAPRVVASLWSVNDYATSELMKRFYQGMLGKEKLRPAAALREAQLAMWKQKRWQAPYYWAAFVMQGEWR